MRKSLFILVFSIVCLFSYGQRRPVSSAKDICTDPAVTMVATFVGSDSFTVEFTPNAECDYYSYVAMTDEDVSLWTTMMGMTLEQIIPMWGIEANTAESHTWTDMAPNTTYKVFALPFDVNSVSYSYNYIEVTTSAIGGSGTAVIDIAVSNVTYTSAYVVCTPNAETSAFYDGLVTVDFYNEIGQDSVCTILRENMTSPYYSEDAWEWSDLIPNTQYYAIAFGQNAEGVWGDTTLYMFQTLSDVSVNDFASNGLSVYPLPNDGNFVVSGENLLGASAQLYSMNGQLMQTFTFSSDSNNVSVSLPAGCYLLQVQNAEGKRIAQNVVVIR